MAAAAVRVGYAETLGHLRREERVAGACGAKYALERIGAHRIGTPSIHDVGIAHPRIHRDCARIGR